MVKLEIVIVVKNLKDFFCDKGKFMIIYFVVFDLLVVLGFYNLICLLVFLEMRSFERGEKEML